MKHLLLNERFVLMAIILNTIIIFIGGFYPDSLLLRISDACFTLLFLAEAVVKIKDAGWRDYWAAGWNRFDFIIILLALPSIATPFLQAGTSTSVLLALRALRIFKSFRMFRFVPNIGSLISGVKLALRSSFLVCIAFVVLLVIFSIMTSALFGSYAPEYFGNPLLSVYSTFRLFTIEGWYEMPDAIAANGSVAMAVIARIYFSILLFVGGIIGMSLINSIFVDAMVADNNDDVMQKLEELEKKLDRITKDQ